MAPQTGQCQSAGRSSNLTPLGIFAFLSPREGSYIYPQFTIVQRHRSVISLMGYILGRPLLWSALCHSLGIKQKECFY